VTGGAVNLDFQIGNLTGSGIHLAGKSGDIILLYEVLGGITGIDQNWGGTVDPATQGANITIIETACSVAFTSASSSCANADILGQLTGTILTGSQAFVGNTNFTTTSYATYIKKDIQFSEGNLSDFVNSADIPEPMTFILLGGGLLGLGILKRRLA
jgi:hypothetical protein